MDPTVAKCAKENLRSFKNVSIINKDARDVLFTKKADLIICEMLDTALIDEEQIPVINSVLKYLKEDGELIPEKMLNGIEPVYMDAGHICYLENDSPYHDVLGKFLIYDEVDFKKKLSEKVKVKIKMNINRKGIMSGIKITSFTILTPDIICGPTPMLNPPLLIPTNRIDVNAGDIIKIDLNYMMGGGLDSIKTKIEKIH